MGEGPRTHHNDRTPPFSKEPVPLEFYSDRVIAPLAFVCDNEAANNRRSIIALVCLSWLSNTLSLSLSLHAPSKGRRGILLTKAQGLVGIRGLAG